MEKVFCLSMLYAVDACLLRAALKTSAVLLLVISFAGSPQAQAQVSSVYTGEALAAVVLADLPPCVGGEHVLLIQDVVPWFAPIGQDPRGANVTELIAQNKPWCGIHSTALAFLPAVNEILIAGAQTQTFYDNLFPGGLIHPNIDAFVLAGGILSANLADFASGPGAGGNWAGDTFVGGVQHVFSLTNDNNITAAGAVHPIITDLLLCPSGNCAVQVDTSPQTDLDGWGGSDPGFFISLPVTATVILTSAGGPVLVEYPHGAGTVVASMNTVEWRYTGAFGSLPENKKLLANDIAYQDDIAVKKVAIDIKFCSNPNGYNCRLRGVVPVTIFGSAGVNVADINIASLQLCLASNPAACTGPPKSSSVADRGNPALDQGASQCTVILDVQQNYRNPDGYPDLDVGFNNQGTPGVAQLVNCPGTKKTASLTLILKGFTTSGTPIISDPIGNPGIDQLWFQ